MEQLQPVDRAVSSAYEALRKKLIQTTLRNRMINYRPPSSRAAVGLHIEKESSEHVFKVLVCDRKKLGFIGAPDKASSPSVDDIEKHLFDEVAPPPIEITNDAADLLLFSNLPKAKLEARLLGTYRAATEQLEERGVNTLFLALGMLKWKEPTEEEFHLAPLLLVPVLLERSARGEFKLAYDEGEIGTNLSLQVKLDELGVKLPILEALTDGFSPTSYFEEVSKLVSRLPGWSVEPDTIGLNFFIFEKIALFIDLDTKRWEPEQNPVRDEDISAALGAGYLTSPEPIPDSHSLDDTRKVGEASEIFPADSSQLLVLEHAKHSCSMVVEGPPGTGKSQTITNLIGELVSQGKRVLFVSEKIAALEVVHRKLVEAGVADAALELHGSKANRRRFYDEIGRTWRLKSRLRDATLQLERLAAVRHDLNEYVRELHRPVDQYGASPRSLFALAASLPAADSEDLNSGFTCDLILSKRLEDLRRLQPLLDRIQQKVCDIGVPTCHPFWGSKLSFFGPDERRETELILAEALASIKGTLADAAVLSEQLGVAPPTTFKELDSLRLSVAIAQDAPILDGISLQLHTWREQEPVVREVIHKLRSRAATIHSYDGKLSNSAWSRNWTSVRTAILARADSFFGRFAGEYKQAIAELRLCVVDAAKPTPEWAKIVSADLAKCQEEREFIESKHELMSRLFGVQWTGIDSRPDSLETLCDWVLRVDSHLAGGRVPESLLNLFAGKIDKNKLSETLQQLESSSATATNDIGRLASKLEIERATLVELPLKEVLSKLQVWTSSLGKVAEIVSWNALAEEAESMGLASVIAFTATWPLAADRLSNHILWYWSRHAIRKALDERTILRNFDRLSHEAKVEEFRRLDDEILRHNRARVAYTHLSNLPQGSSVGLTSELSRQCELKRGHKPVRWAFERFTDLLLQIKPVCMMSPLSVATFLPRRANLFDVVIFDEASQIKPEDALSAMARARQTIVVGDTRQMPPTSFFDSLAADEDDDELEHDSAVGKMESILALCSASVQNTSRRQYLRWHYRSLHHSLIQPSNRLFYEDRLVIFPSPSYAAGEATEGLGILLHHDPTATYDRGSAKKINAKQAEQIASAVMKHLRETPHESLLVVAFSKDQQQAIQDAYELVRDPALEAEYAALHPHEKFTIKNLETVQGDERDVIFISIGYGRDVSGHLTMNFGPLNREGGGRRLNVLITRAKRRTEVFTSIRSGDIHVSDQKETGLHALKVFLEFAETGILEERKSESDEEESVFETEVRRALESRGYTVDAQVGTAGFRIDLAVRHPEKPGVYALGIECDGASYHSARSARDRDKLRQLVLESRGWRIHRIWSTDWWQNRDQALERCIVAIQAAVEEYGVDQAQSRASEQELSAPPVEELQLWEEDSMPSTEQGAAYKPWTKKFQLQGYDLHALPPQIMAKCVAAVTYFEGPIHRDLLVKRVREGANLGRAGSRIKSAVELGIEVAKKARYVRIVGDFLYPVDDRAILARNRADLPAADCTVEKLPVEEIDDAIRSVLAAAHRANADEIAVGVRKLFGYGSMPTLLPAMVNKRLATMQKKGSVAKSGDQFHLP